MISKLKKKIKKKLKKYLNKSKKAYFRIVYKVFTLLPIHKDAVAFLSDSRSNLTGNFEYIDREIKSRQTALKISYMLKKTNSAKKTFGEYTKIAWLIATSQHVLLDDFYPLKIRNNVNLIQVWHAVGAFKTFGFSRMGLPGGPKPTSKNHKNYTWAIVSSKRVAPFYAEGFGIDDRKVLPLGAPRTDMFFDTTVVTRLEEELPFIKGKKVVLFAPTFRGNGQRSAYYNFDWIDFEKLYTKLSVAGYVVLFKIHPFVKNKVQIPEEYADFFYDVSSYREVNDLLLVSDALITDYSSVVFEYSLLRKKTIFFAPDLEEYTDSRDFYVDYQEFVPGPIVRDMDSLVTEIERVNEFNPQSLDNFLAYYFDDLDGKASKRFVDALENNFVDFR